MKEAVGGYVLWNVLLYLAVGLHGGRFDAQASWGALLLAIGLGYSIAAPGRNRPTQPAGR